MADTDLSGSQPKLASWLRACLGLLCLALFAAILWNPSHSAPATPNDFVPLYVAATQAGGPSLYDPEVYYDFQRQRFGQFSKALVFSRPPYYALLLKPLTWLGSFEAAKRCFTLLRAAAIAAFLLLWPGRRADALFFVCMSFPLAASFSNGQDVAFLLPLLALALRLESGGRAFQAGIALAMCALKFHLFILLPISLVAQKRWRMIGGLAAGAAGLVIISFAAAGWSWPIDYFNLLSLVLASPEVNPSTRITPTLYGLLDGAPHSRLWELIGYIAAAGGVWTAARRGDFALGLSAAVLGSFMVSRHAYAADLAIFLPLMLATAKSAKTAIADGVATVWLTPFLPIILLFGRPWSYIPQLAVPAALAAYSMAPLNTRHDNRPASPQKDTRADF